MRLKDRIAIITGGANGIGKATALRFAEEGAKVVLWDLADDAGEAVVAEIKKAGGEASYKRVNVTVTEEVEAAVKEVSENLKSVDILVNNAGILRDGQLVKYKNGEVVSRMSDEQFDSVIAVNLRGVFVCARAVTPYMIEQGSGRILNASSVVGLYGNFGQTNYVATKFAVIGMTKVWARELGKYGIRVNAIAPGFIETEMVKQMPEKVLDGMVSHTPIKRIGKPVDIANTYLFLASDESEFINGATISVDGGVVTGT